MDDSNKGNRITRLWYHACGAIDRYMFPNIPEHYPLRKKILIAKTDSDAGALWDSLQAIFVITICILYVLSRGTVSYEASQLFFLLELIITQLFMADYLLNAYLHFSWAYFTDYISIIDVVTLAPVYYLLITEGSSNVVNFFRCLRVLRLMRTFHTMKLIRNMNAIRRQMALLTGTLVSMVFLTACLIELVENDVWQGNSDCKYISALTEWQPSAERDSLVFGDCPAGNCEPHYNYGDHDNEPSGINCVIVSFYDSMYFVLVTVATVGYGDVLPSNHYSKIIVMLFILVSIIVIPMRINELQKLLSMRSPFRAPYVRQSSNDCHVIICGHVTNRQKLERFFQEFFHTDRTAISGKVYHAVILSSVEPPEDVRALISSATYDVKVSYVVGSALNIEDLKRVRADVASCMFFLCNVEVEDAKSNSEDAATVLRALAVSNFNPNLTCLVQVLRPEDRAVLKDSDISVILCLQEFKTALQARNAVCPGFSTFVDNIFHSIEDVSDELKANMSPWYKEYLHGAGMEIYFVHLPKSFLVAMRYNYSRIVEAVFIQFKVILLGLTSADRAGLIFNPCKRDVEEFKNFKDFFRMYHVGLIMAGDQHEADEIATGLNDPAFVLALLRKMDVEEKSFPCRLKVADLAPVGVNPKTGLSKNMSKFASFGMMVSKLHTPIKKSTFVSRMYQRLTLAQHDEVAAAPKTRSKFHRVTEFGRLQLNKIRGGRGRSHSDEMDQLSNNKTLLNSRADTILSKKIREIREKKRRASEAAGNSGDAPPDNSSVNIIQKQIKSKLSMKDLQPMPIEVPEAAKEVEKKPMIQRLSGRLSGYLGGTASSVAPLIQEEAAEEDDIPSVELSENIDSIVDDGLSDSGDDDDDDAVSNYIGFRKLENDEEAVGQRPMGSVRGSFASYGDDDDLDKYANSIASRGRSVSESATIKPAAHMGRGRSGSDGAAPIARGRTVSESATTPTSSNNFRKHVDKTPGETPPRPQSGGSVGGKQKREEKLTPNAASVSVRPLSSPATVTTPESTSKTSQSKGGPAPSSHHRSSGKGRTIKESPSSPKKRETDSSAAPSTPVTYYNVKSNKLPLSKLQVKTSKTPLSGPPLTLLTKLSKRAVTQGHHRQHRKQHRSKPSAVTDKSMNSTHDSDSEVDSSPRRSQSAHPTRRGQDHVMRSADSPAPCSSTNAHTPALRRPMSAHASLNSQNNSNPQNHRVSSDDDADENDEEDVPKAPVTTPPTSASTSRPLSAETKNMMLNQYSNSPTVSVPSSPKRVLSTSMKNMILKQYSEEIEEDDEDSEGGDTFDVSSPPPINNGRGIGFPASTASRPFKSAGAPPIKDKPTGLLSSLFKNNGGGRARASSTDSIDDDDDYQYGDDDDPVAINKRNAQLWKSGLGRESREIEDAQSVKNHILVMGCDLNLPMFISELRRPVVKGDTYHTIVIVGDHVPRKWEGMKAKYNDIFFISCVDIVDNKDLPRLLNVEQCFSLILLSSRKGLVESTDVSTDSLLNIVDEESVDAVTLFTYLKLEQHIPKNVFCSVELNCASNMAVLNATIMRRARVRLLSADAVNDNSMPSAVTGIARASVSSTARKLSLPSGKKTSGRSSSPGPVKVNTIEPTPPKAPTPRRMSAFSHVPQAKFQMRSDDPVLKSAISMVKQSSSSFKGPLSQSSLRNNSNSSQSSLEDNTTKKTSLPWLFAFLTLSRSAQVASSETSTNPTVPTNPTAPAADETAKGVEFTNDNKIWDMMQHHYILPVFASARAFVPSSFESLLVQSFYVEMTPVICEKLVCGQLGQTVMHASIPKTLVGRQFKDLFRMYIQHQVLCFGLYRAPVFSNGSLLPYTYISPLAETILAEHDKIFVYGSTSNLTRAQIAAKKIQKQ